MACPAASWAVSSAACPTRPAPVQAVRVGGQIKEPKKLKNVNPAYPDIAKQARVQGVVILECTISPQGKVTDVKVLRGIPLLDAGGASKRSSSGSTLPRCSTACRCPSS